MIMTRYFCTYFDYRYLPRALALYKSLKQHCNSFCLWALCFDDITYKRLMSMKLKEVYPISHEDFIQNDDQLIDARKNRSLVEYYFTCSPSLPLYVLNKNPNIEQLTYLDADLFFFSDPEPLFDEIGPASIAIIPHRFSMANRHLEINGIYNVSWLTFRRDIIGLICLKRWREQCLEWCYDRIEGTRYADQGYLTDWPETYQNVTIIQHKGADLAPWNISGSQLFLHEGHIWVDDEPLIFFHFQSLACIRSAVYKLNLSIYKKKASSFIREEIYAPYIRTVEEILRKEKLTYIPSKLRDTDDALHVFPLKQIISIIKHIIKRTPGLFQGEYMFPWDYL